MPRKSSTIKHNEATWSKFKHTLHDLYIAKDLPLKDVMQAMKDKYDFEASKSHYTSHFKSWEFEKYSKTTPTADWKRASFKVSKAQRRGKEVRLSRNGKLVTQKMLRTQGHLTALDQIKFTRDSSPQTPPDFTISVQSPLIHEDPNLPFERFWKVISEKIDHHPDLVIPVDNPTVSELLKYGQSLSMHFPTSIAFPVSTSNQGEIQKIDHQQWLQLFAYLLSNNFIQESERDSATEDDLAMRKGIFRTLKNMDGFKLLISSAAIHQPSLRAILEKILPLAIESRDLDVVRHLLHNGVDPNNHHCYLSSVYIDYKGSRDYIALNPLQFILLSGDLSTSKLLISHGAKLDQPGMGWKSSAIVLAIIGWRNNLNLGIIDEAEDLVLTIEEKSQIITDFVFFLVERGAYIYSEDLGINFSNPCLERNPLMTFYAHHDVLINVQHSPLTIASKYHLKDLVTKFLKVQAGSGTPCKAEMNMALATCIVGYLHNKCDQFQLGPMVPINHFPKAIIIQLCMEGGDLNEIVSYCRRSSPYDLAYLRPLEYAIFRENEDFAVNQLLMLGAKPMVGTFSHCMRKKKFHLCSQILPAFYSHIPDGEKLDSDVLEEEDADQNIVNKDDMKKYNVEEEDPSEDSKNTEDIYTLFQSLKLGETSWIVESIDQIKGDNQKKYFLQKVLCSCEPKVAGELLSLCQGAVGCFSPNVWQIKRTKMLPILSTMSLESLDSLYEQEFEWNLRHASQNLSGLLHQSIIHKNIPLAEYLIQKGLQINEIIKYNGVEETALCAAVRRRRPKIAAKLVERGAMLKVGVGACICGLTRYSTALITAAECQNPGMIKFLVSKGAQLNSYGVSRFNHFISKNWPCLLDIDNSNSCSCVTPLTASILGGKSRFFVRFLLESGAEPNNPTIEGCKSKFSPLAAVSIRNKSYYIDSKLYLTEVLLDAGVNPLDLVALRSSWIQDNGLYQEESKALQSILHKLSCTSTTSTMPEQIRLAALSQAVRVMNPDLVKSFLNRKANQISIAESTFEIDPSTLRNLHPSSVYLQKPIHDCVQKCDEAVDSLQLLNTALLTGFSRHEINISFECRFTIISLLLEAGFSPNDYSHECKGDLGSPLYNAILLGEVRILDLLLKAGARLSVKDYQFFGCPYQTPRVLHRVEIAKVLIKNHIKPMNISKLHKSRESKDIILESALQSAVISNSLDMTEFLIENSADVNTRGNVHSGATALQLALMVGHFDIATLLMDNGADVNATPSTFNGDDCLQIVARRGNVEWVKILVRAGAKVDASPGLNILGNAFAVQWGARVGSLDIVRYLVEHGAEVNAAAQPGGGTALQFAARGGFLPVAEYLIRHGADVNAAPLEKFKTYKGAKPALEEAAENGRLDIVQLLLENGAGENGGIFESAKNAWKLAKENGHHVIGEMIKQYFDYRISDYAEID